MFMEIQTVDSIDKMVTGLIRRSPKIRLLTLFRKSRSVECISWIGDFTLIAHLISLIVKNTGNKVNRWGIRKAINESEELRALEKWEKTETIDELIRMQKLSVAQMKKK